MTHAVVLICLIPFLAGCGYMNIPVSSSSYIKKQGAVFTSSHRKEQTFLYLVDGARISIDGEPEIAVPWGVPTFINLNEGKHSYKIWYNYLNMEMGEASGCIYIHRNSTVLVGYQTSYSWLFSPKIEVSNLTGETNGYMCEHKDK